MKTKTLMIGLVLIAVVLGPLAIAEPEDGPREPRRGGPGAGPNSGWQRLGGGLQGGGFAQMLLGRLGEKLNLTEEQKAQIKAIVEENKDNVKAAGEAVREAMRALREATEGGVEAEIIAAGKAVGDAFTEQALQRANIAKQVKDILTEEQKAQLKEMRSQMQERMQQWREGGQGNPPRGTGRPRGRRQAPPEEEE